MIEAALRTIRQRPGVFSGAALLLLAVLAVGAGEWLGWPFLAGPLERTLAQRLERSVRLDAAPNATNTTNTTNTTHTHGFRIRFLGGVRLTTPELEIGAPAWSQAPHFVQAGDVALDLRYIDLWRAYRGQSLRIDRLQAATLEAQVERLADGRVSWQLGPQDGPATPAPTIGSLQVTDGRVRYRDEPLEMVLDAKLSLVDASPAMAGGEGVASGSALRVTANGSYRRLPLKMELVSAGVLPWSADADAAPPIPLTLKLTVGRTSLDFDGRAADALHLDGLAGRFSLKGPSLAAVGDPLGVTLPTTGAFRSQGVVVKQGDTWQVTVDDATVGASHLNGAFVFEAGRPVPLLSGRLGGSRLWLADLGPVLGTTPRLEAAPVEGVAAKPASKAAGKAAGAVAGKAAGKAAGTAVGKAVGKVFPARPFDLAALRAMDANVLIDIAEVDLNTSHLEPLRPLHAHLQLAGGVLSLRGLSVRMGDGEAKGDLVLDGRGEEALWNMDLRWTGVRLERWVRQQRAAGAPPYVAGRMNGRAVLQGQGRSTAGILASLKGTLQSDLRDGRVSHLVVELGGLDVAEALGFVFSGDEALPVQCARADLVVDGGVFRPRVFVLDTADSAVWVEGSLSLATEALDLRAVVVPKDFSPLTLRAPLRVTGSFGNPALSIETAPLAMKIAASVLLAFVNPLAALIPLIDPGDAEEARRAAAGCAALTQRAAAAIAKAPTVH